MISIYMILTALTTAALGKGAVECNFSEPIEDQRCFGAVGQPLIFYLPAAADGEIRLMKDKARMILIVKNQVETKDYTHSGDYTSGTLNFGNATKKHSGDYTLEEFNLDGVSVKKTNVHLQLQVPVSEPVVSQVCLSPEQMKVSCSTDGEAVEFTMILDGHSLIKTRDQSLSPSSRTTNPPSPTEGAAEQNKTSVSISLHGQLTGDLMCNVQNNVSRSQTVFHLTSCKGEDPTSSLFFVVTVAVIAGIIVLLVAFCLGKKSLQNKSRRPITTNVVPAGNSEVIYADVKVTRKVKKPQPTTEHTMSSSTVIYRPEVSTTF